MSEPPPDAHRRYWPRDGPIRWGWFMRGLAARTVAIIAIAAHLVIGVLSIVAILGDAVDGAGEWLLAIAWAGLALWQVWAWWFLRGAVVVAPLVAGVLLLLLAGANP